MSQTAARTLDLLEQIAGSSRPLKLMELAGATGLDKSTAARLLGFLEERALIQRQPATKGYGVGPNSRLRRGRKDQRKFCKNF